MRRKIYEITEVSTSNNSASKYYDCFMIAVIILSLIPIAFKQETTLLIVLNYSTVTVFIIDYFLRLITADIKLSKKGFSSFIRYPFTPMAIVDLISILPSFIGIGAGFKLLRVIRMVRAMRVLRVFKALRYSKSLIIIGRVLKSSKDSLLAVGSLAIGYILVSALIILNVEPDSFNNFFDAIYWATVSLTTVGYGDIYPVSTIGRVITMISSFFGIAIVALPAGIITAGYMREIEKDNNPEDKG